MFLVLPVVPITEIYASCIVVADLIVLSLLQPFLRCFYLTKVQFLGQSVPDLDGYAVAEYQKINF